MAGHPSRLSSDSYGPTFNWDLKKRIASDFIEYVDNPIRLNDQLISRKVALSGAEESELKAIHRTRGSHEANDFLLSVLIKKENWFQNLIGALKHDRIGLTWLAERFINAQDYLLRHPEESSESDAGGGTVKLWASKGVSSVHPRADQTFKETPVKRQPTSSCYDEVDGPIRIPGQSQGQGSSNRNMSSLSGHSRSSVQRQFMDLSDGYLTPVSSTGQVFDHVYDIPEYLELGDESDARYRKLDDASDVCLYDDFELVEEEEYDDGYDDALSKPIPICANQALLDKTGPETNTKPASLGKPTGSDKGEPLGGSSTHDPTKHKTTPTPCNNGALLSKVSGSQEKWDRKREMPSSERSTESSYENSSEFIFEPGKLDCARSPGNVTELTTNLEKSLSIAREVIVEKSDNTNGPAKEFTRQEVDTQLSAVPGYIKNITDHEVDSKMERSLDGTYVLWYFEEEGKPAFTVMFEGKVKTFLVKKRSSFSGFTYYIFNDQMQTFTLKELITHHLTSGVRDRSRQMISLQTPLT